MSQDATRHHGVSEANLDFRRFMGENISFRISQGGFLPG